MWTAHEKNCGREAKKTNHKNVCFFSLCVFIDFMVKKMSYHFAEPYAVETVQVRWYSD